MLKFITTKTGCSSLHTALGVGAGGTAAFALVVMKTGTGVFHLSVLLLLGAALFKASADLAEGGTRALVAACVRVGLVAGSAFRKRAAFTARTHQC